MAKPPPPTSEIRRKLIDTIGAERRDMLVFSFLTVLLTPAFVALSVVVLLLALNQLDHSHGRVLWDDRVLVHTTAGFLGASCGMFFVKPGSQPGLSRKDLIWFAAGVAVLAWILYLAYLSPLRRENPRWFWPLYAGLSILMLGMLGRGYVPRDHDYMRPGEWSLSDSPGDRQAEETDFWFGWASAFPGLLLGSYGNIFGSGWLWGGLKRPRPLDGRGRAPFTGLPGPQEGRGASPGHVPQGVGPNHPVALPAGVRPTSRRDPGIDLRRRTLSRDQRVDGRLTGPRECPSASSATSPCPGGTSARRGAWNTSP
jgi:hypothetical protein